MKTGRCQGSQQAPVSVAIVGCGKHARNRLIPVILSRHDVFRLAAICDTNPLVIEEADFPQCSLLVDTDISRVVARDDIQGVIVATHADAHAGVTRRALDAGKYVFVEKPPAQSSREWESTCGAFPSRVMVGFMKRFVPAYSMLSDWISAKNLSPRLFTGSFRSGGYPDMEAFLFDFGIHLLDLACVFLGTPLNVYTVPASGDAPCVLAISIAYERAVASISFSWCGGWAQHAEYVEVNGAGWLARVDNARRLDIYPAETIGVESVATPAHLTWEPNYPVSWREIKDQNLNGYEPELLAFADLCRTGKPQRPGYQDGLTTLRLCEAVAKSAAQGGEIVTLQ